MLAIYIYIYNLGRCMTLDINLYEITDIEIPPHP